MNRKLYFFFLCKYLTYRFLIAFVLLFCVGYSSARYIRTFTYDSSKFESASLSSPNSEFYRLLRLETFPLPFGENANWLTINIQNNVLSGENIISASSTFRICDTSNLSLCEEFQVGGSSRSETFFINLGNRFQNARNLSFVQADILCDVQTIFSCFSTIQIELRYSSLSNFYGYPNPFRRSVTPEMRFFVEVLEDAEVSLVIYDRNRKFIRSIYDDSFEALATGTTLGGEFFTWDGTTSKGHQVSSGIYLAFLRVRYTQTPSMSYERSFKIIYVHQ